jgi:hypothetical protein
MQIPLAMPRLTRWSFILIPLALLFLLQPIVVYVAEFPPDECDDKAVHFFSAMYFAASATSRATVEQMTRPVVLASDDEDRQQRANFRLGSTAAYPLTNMAITLVHGRDTWYTESVKWSRLGVTLLAVVTVALIAGATPFGLWYTILVLNLIAFDVIPAFGIGPVPDNAHPFITSAPRGSGSLLVIAIVLALAARKRGLFCLSLALVFLWHVGQGLLVVSVVLPGAVGFWLVTRRHDLDFTGRALVLTLLVLSASMIVSTVAAAPAVGRLLEEVAGSPVGRQVPQRLAGVEYSLLVLGVVVGVMLAVDRLATRFAWLQKQRPGVRIGAALFILGVIGGLHARMYSEVLVRRSTGFFSQPLCERTPLIPLPEQAARLSLGDEPALFLSLGTYLLDQRLGQ